MSSDNSTNDDEAAESNDKVFFTTSDLVKMINGIMKENSPKGLDFGGITNNDGGDDQGGFELQRKLPNGSTRKADESEIEIADLRSKIKQTADNISKLSPDEKIKWAKEHRQYGNKLYAKKQYKEAMDVYLTCLVAIDLKKDKENDGSNNSSSVTKSCTNGIDNDNCNRENMPKEDKNTSDLSGSSHDEWIERIDNEIKLPVLMNLSACTLKLGMHRKTCTFCNMTVEMKPEKINPKVYFRRGKSHMLLGLYKKAQVDFDECLELLESYDDGIIIDLDKRKNEIDAVHKEFVTLRKLIGTAEKNRKRHEKAMKMVLGGDTTIDSSKKSHDKKKNSNPVLNKESNSSPSQNTNSRSSSVEDLLDHPSNVDETNQMDGLYSDIHNGPKREYSTLRAKRRQRVTENDAPPQSISKTYFLWYIQMLEHGLRKFLFWLGDEDAMTRSYLDDEEQEMKGHASIHQSTKSKQL